MKAALFNRVPYLGAAPRDVWPTPGGYFAHDVAVQSMDQSLEQFQLADEVGFDWVTVAEHHYAPFSLTPNPMVMAGALTQRVKRAKIALLGADIPILEPLRVAEELAMLDVMSNGRLVAGMLRGTANEYVTYATNPAESRERFEEALRLIVRAWTEPQPFGWQGRYYEYRSISIWPRPIQQPHPPIYMSGSSPESGEFAAKNYVKLGFAVTTLPLAVKAAQHYRQQANDAGWEPAPDDVLYRLSAHVAETDEQAMDDLEIPGAIENYRLSSINQAVAQAVFASGYHGRDAVAQQARTGRGPSVQDRIGLGQLLVGGPDTVLKQVKSIRDQLGAGILDLSFLPVGREKALRAIELFGTKVLPRMREL
jgi:alkanesulfonate monooxygenase SsuD/methylene tetrahydromethanopterin reductase-like flavin-dependent oxidoreductase (luciferase family)